MTSRNGRAAPLSPAARRETIVAATVPLLQQHGLAVSTRQIADAAGVAEGTLFRVFPDKQALVLAAVDAALDPEPGMRKLAAIDRSAPLEDRLTQAVEMLRAGMENMWRLMVELRTAEGQQSALGKVFGKHRWEHVMATIAGLFEPDRDRLAVTPEQATRILHSMLFASVRPLRSAAGNDTPLTTKEIVGVVLHGITNPRTTGNAAPHTDRTGVSEC